MVLEAKVINISSLPSKGRTYGELNFELAVRPVTAKEEMSTNLEKYGITQSLYYETLLNNIEIRGGSFNKKDLLLGDVQFIDLVRRLFTYEVTQVIEIQGQKCEHCGKDLIVKFMLADPGDKSCEHFVDFEEYRDDIFGKEFIFSDETKIKISPITVGQILNLSRKYLSNIKSPDDMIDYLFALRAETIVESDGRIFETKESMHKYFIDYFKDLYKRKDLNILEQIDDETSIIVKPFQVKCRKMEINEEGELVDKGCGEITEVSVSPSFTFHQE